MINSKKYSSFNESINIYTISGTVVYNTGGPYKGVINTPIPNVPIALQIQGDKTILGEVTETGTVTKTDSTGRFTFINVPSNNSYRVVEAGQYIDEISSTGDWNNSKEITITPIDPYISQVTNAPSNSNRICSISPNTVFIDKLTENIDNIYFIDIFVNDIPLSLGKYVITGKNLFTAADNGTFGNLPNGTPVQTSPTSNPYSGFGENFQYVQYEHNPTIKSSNPSIACQNDEPGELCTCTEGGYPTCPPYNGQYSLSNTVDAGPTGPTGAGGCCKICYIPQCEKSYLYVNTANIEIKEKNKLISLSKNIQKRGYNIRHLINSPIINLSANKSFMFNCTLNATIFDITTQSKVDVELLVDGHPYPGMDFATIFSNNEVIKIIGLAIIKTSTCTTLSLINRSNCPVKFSNINVTIIEI